MFIRQRERASGKGIGRERETGNREWEGERGKKRVGRRERERLDKESGKERKGEGDWKKRVDRRWETGNGEFEGEGGRGRLRKESLTEGEGKGDEKETGKQRERGTDKQTA